MAIYIAVQMLVCIGASAQTLSATNDDKAQFVGGTFVLPDLTDPKDSYTIVVVAGDKETKVPLPAGGTAIRLIPAALPTQSWSWRYVLSRAKLPHVDVLQPIGDRFTFDQLARYDNGVLLVWRETPGAVNYKVVIVPDKADSLAKPPDWGKESSEDLAEDSVDSDCKCVHYVRTSKPGDRFKWKAVALGADNSPIAETEYRQISVDEPWSKSIAAGGFKLQRSDTLAKDVAGKPALLGYQSNQKDGSSRTSAYLAQFAVVWSDPTVSLDGGVFYPRASLEAKLSSSGSDKANDAIRLRAGGYAVFPESPWNLVTNLKYDTERKTGTKKGSLEVMVTPTFAPFVRYYPRPTAATTDPAGNFTTRPWLQLMPTLQLGAEVGRTFDEGSSSEVGKNLSRARADLRLDAELNFLASAFRLPSVSVYGGTTYWRLGHQTADEFMYSTAGASFKLTQDVSIEFTYSVGRDAPTFNFIRLGAVGLGLQIK